MNVDKVMTKNVRTCREHDSMEVAARHMWEGDCGIVPVVGENNRLVGVITDRDACMAAWTRGLPLAAIRVGEGMSRAPQSCSPQDTVEAAEDAMRQHRVRRLPVTEGDRVVGIVSVSDLARAATSQPRTVAPERLMTTLASICEPRTSTQARVERATG